MPDPDQTTPQQPDPQEPPADLEPDKQGFPPDLEDPDQITGDPVPAPASDPASEEPE